jgi:hypothetical protein
MEMVIKDENLGVADFRGNSIHNRRVLNFEIGQVPKLSGAGYGENLMASQNWCNAAFELTSA